MYLNVQVRQLHMGNLCCRVKYPLNPRPFQILRKVGAIHSWLIANSISKVSRHFLYSIASNSATNYPKAAVQCEKK